MSGTGKSHLLIALGTEAAMKGCRVRYTLATKLVEAADESFGGNIIKTGTQSYRLAQTKARTEAHVG